MQDSRKATEMAIVTKFKLKLTSITEMASYNWVTTTASSQPSQYIDDMMQFLVSNCQILTIVHSLTVSVSVCASYVHGIIPCVIHVSDFIRNTCHAG